MNNWYSRNSTSFYSLIFAALWDDLAYLWDDPAATWDAVGSNWHTKNNTDFFDPA